MSEQTKSSLSLPVRILFQAVLTILLVWILNELIPQYFAVKGGVAAFVIIGCLMTLMNIIVRPVLHVLLIPLKLFATILALILTNAGFVWITLQIAAQLDPNIVQLVIKDGFLSWMLVAIIFGIANFFYKHTL